MIDIEAMRKEKMREIELAEMANEIMSEHPEIEASGLYVKLWDFNHTNGDVTTNVLVGENYPHRLDEKDAAMLLSLFPANRTFQVYRGTAAPCVSGYYDMRLHRNPSQPRTMLSIYWRHDDLHFHVEFPITSDSNLNKWFKDSTRKLEESEISAYGIQKNRYTYNMRNNFAQLDWAEGRVIHYAGDYWQQTDDALLILVARHLKSQYQLGAQK